MNIYEVIERIKKAVRLANKTTEAGERETALRLARSLAEKNGVAFDEIQAGERDADKAVLDEENEWHAVKGVELGFSCYILKRHFGVILMVTPKRDRKYMKSYSWIGSRLNIAIAKHVHHILMRESARAWREASKDRLAETHALMQNALITRKEANKLLRDADRRNGTPTLNRSAFLKGFFWQIDQKLTANPLRNDIDIDRAAAERKLLQFKEQHTVRDQQGRKTKVDANSIIAGVTAANGVNLSRPCEGRGSTINQIGNATRLALSA